MSISFEHLHIVNWQLSLKSRIIKSLHLVEISTFNILLLKGQDQESLVEDFPGSPVVKTSSSNTVGYGFDPWSGS